MALSTQSVIASLMEKFGNGNGDIVGMSQDELVRAFQQVDATPKSRKTRKSKDLNAPKRPTSAYLIWLNENRSQITEEHCAHLSGRDKVKETSRTAGRLWKEMTEENKAPYVEKFKKEQIRYASEKEGYVPSTPKIQYDVNDFPEAPEGWSGPFQMKYLSKIVRGDDDKIVPIFKVFAEAVEFANQLPKDACGGITKTARGYQLRVGSELVTNPPEHARTGLASWVKGEPAVPANSDKLVKKVTFAEDTDSDSESQAPVKRGRGRPKGSKNKAKATESTEQPIVDEPAPAKRGRGRPKGSKNKAKSPTPEAVSQPNASFEEITLDIGEGDMTYMLNTETRELYEVESGEKIGEIDEHNNLLE